MLIYQDEIEVIFSLLSDRELINVKERLRGMKERRDYRNELFPLSSAGLNYLIFYAEWSFWCRKGKGVRFENGEIRVCELEESPIFWRYREKEIVGELRKRRMERGEEGYYD